MSIKSSLQANIWYFRIVAAIISWTGIILRFIPSSQTPEEAFIEPIKFFTVQTNLMVAIWLTLAVIYKDYRSDMNTSAMDRLYGTIKGGITSFITLTWIAYWILLSSSYGYTGFRGLSSDINHYVIPIYFIADWFITERESYSLKDVGIWLVYPLIYLLFAYIMQIGFNDPIYSILNMSEDGFAGFANSAVMLFVAFVIFCLIYFGLNKLFIKENQD